jgi:hypothetical protein
VACASHRKARRSADVFGASHRDGPDNTVGVAILTHPLILSETYKNRVVIEAVPKRIAGMSPKLHPCEIVQTALSR